MKKVYSLTKNGAEILSVEIELPPGLPIQPTLNKNWLRSTVAEQFVRKTPRRFEGHEAPSASVRVTASAIS
jgi:hypothetical protein